MTTSVGSRLDERVLDYWHRHRELLPEATALAADKPELFQELLDAIPDHEHELRIRLAQYES